MQDFTRYNYMIKESDLLRVLEDAAAHGCKPTVIINGEFYDVELDAENIPSAASAASAASADLPF